MKSRDPFFDRPPRQWRFDRAVENVAIVTVVLIVLGLLARWAGL